MPDTGMRSWAGVGPPDGTMPDPPPGAWRQHGKCPSCGHRVVRNPEAEVESLQTWRVERPLFRVGGTAFVRATDPPSDGGETVYNDSGSGTLTISGGGSILPDEVRVNRTAFEIGAAGFGAFIGSEVMGHTGAAIGGVAAFMWGRRYWSKG
jgi:hypothetical protein